MFQVNQIVKGRVFGTFVILAFRTVGGEKGAQVKAVNPDNHSETQPGEFFLPFDALRTL